MSARLLPARRPVALVVTLWLLLAGCAGVDDGAPVDGALDDHPSVDALAAFAATNGLDGLAASTVRITAGDSDLERLTVDALVADTRAARSRGLQQVAEVPAGVGMLFVFPEPAGPAGRPGFWMLDTLVPLDIVFATEDGDVVGTATMRPCTARPCPTTHPGAPYDVALEVAAGTLDAAGVQVGDRLVRVDGPTGG